MQRFDNCLMVSVLNVLFRYLLNGMFGSNPSLTNSGFCLAIWEIKVTVNETFYYKYLEPFLGVKEQHEIKHTAVNY